MNRRILFFLTALVMTGMFFWSCSDDGGSTNPPPTPSLKIISPNGGEIVQMGNVVKIFFENELTDSVAIQLYKSGEYLDDIESLVTTADSLEWLVPNGLAVGTDYQIKIVSIEDETKFDMSDGTFTVAPAGNYIIVTSPNGGGIWLKGTTKQITWYDNIPGGVNIFLLKNGVPVDDIFGTPQASSGTKSWAIPDDGSYADGADYAIQIVSVDNPAVNDISDYVFCLATNDNTQNIVGDWDAVGTWSKWATVWNFNADGTFINDFDEEGTWYMVGNGLRVEFDLYTHSFLAIVDGNHLEGTMANITGSEGTWYADRVIPELTSPNGGQVFMRGTTQTITWNPGSYGNMVINLADSTGVVQNIATVPDSLGTYDWAIPSNVEPGAAYLIRIEKEINPLAFDESDNYICISADESPYVIGEWRSEFIVTKADMVLNFNADNSGTFVRGGSTWDFVWSITGNGLKFVINGYENSWIGIVDGDKVSGTFSDGGNLGLWNGHRYIDVTYPNGGEIFQDADIITLTWDENLSAEYVNIDLYENDAFVRSLFSNLVNDNDQIWDVPGDLVTSTKYKIRITSAVDADIFDESDGYFTIDGLEAAPAVEDENFEDGAADNWTAVTGTWTVADSLLNVTQGAYTQNSVVTNYDVTGNYVYEAKMKKTAGEAYYYGLVFNGSDTDSLSATDGWFKSSLFVIRTDGTYGMWTYDNGAWPVSTGYIASTAVNTGLDVWNVLKVIVNNDTGDHHLFVNGQYLQTINSDYFTGGKLGLVVYDSGLVGAGSVDYVKAYQINKGELDTIEKIIRNTDINRGTPVNE